MEAIRDLINFFSYPQWSFTLSLVVFGVMLWSRKLWTKKGGLLMLVVVTALFCVSLLDPNFRQVVAKPDNVPIVMMVFIVGYFLWLSLYKGFRNDELTAAGEPTFEKSEAEDKIFTWPDLVFSEFICMVILTVVLVIWSIALQAPLEEPANPSVAPNPSKAPWYFLGLQEMLVYFDPWMAGVVLPGLIIVGLIGTFLRGPNWNFFGPFEFWDITKIEPLVNVDLSEIIWIKLLHVGLPSHWFVREIFGIVLLVAYLFILPVVLSKTRFFKKYYEKMGPARFYIGISLFLVMMLLPIKMYFRWLFNLKYFIHIQEFFFNV